MTLASRPSRPWALIAAALLLAVLSTILLVEWRDSRTRADQLQEELRRVYAEAEDLRTEATRARQRVGELERELGALRAAHAGAKQQKPAAKPKSKAR